MLRGRVRRLIAVDRLSRDFGLWDYGFLDLELRDKALYFRYRDAECAQCLRLGDEVECCVERDVRRRRYRATNVRKIGQT